MQQQGEVPSSYLETSASSVASISSSVTDSIHDEARREAIQLRRGRQPNNTSRSGSFESASTSSLEAATKLQKLTAQFDSVFSQEASEVVRQIHHIEGRLGKLREVRHPLEHECTLNSGSGSRTINTSSGRSYGGGDDPAPIQHAGPQSPGEPFHHLDTTTGFSRITQKSRTPSSAKNNQKAVEAPSSNAKIAILEQAVAHLKKENKKLEKAAAGTCEESKANRPGTSVARPATRPAARQPSPVTRKPSPITRSSKTSPSRSASSRKDDRSSFLPLDSEVSSMESEGTHGRSASSSCSGRRPPRTPTLTTALTKPQQRGRPPQKPEQFPGAGEFGIGFVHSGSPIVGSKVRSLSVQLKQLDRTQTQQEALLKRQRRALDQTVQSLDSLHSELSCRRYIDPSSVKGSRGMHNHWKK